jgi:hypothetical protein
MEKKIPVETIPGMGTIRGMEGGKDKIEWEGGVSSMTYLIHNKNFCKCHDVPLPSTIIKKL